MARILIADDGIEFDGHTLDTSPLGGVESSIIYLTTELVRRGHKVQVRNRCKAAVDYLGVEWRPFSDGDWPVEVDLYIANRGHNLLNLMPRALRTVFWIHNPGKYLMKLRYLSKLWKLKPSIIFIGEYHSRTYPRWAPGGERIVIPYGIPDIFCFAEPSLKPPKPRAIFTSNPLRSLDWLLDLWVHRIQPAVPKAELHLFSGALTYKTVGYRKKLAIDPIIEQAKAASKTGVVVRGPVTKAQLVEEFKLARCMLYRGDVNETFCLAVGEAQASGVPAVVQNLGSVTERVNNGATGYIVADDDGFVDKAIRLLTSDEIWEAQHKKSLETQKDWRWSDAAKAFESLI